ncbi:MAG: FAD-binding oxidoreductase [Steroidobacteraceae bacterium]
MKRRAFCASAVATLGAAALPIGRIFAATVSTGAGVSAVTSDGRQIVLSRSDIDDFRASLRGRLLLPGAAGYDDARKIWNGMFDRRPALIARCAGAADVVQSVNFARAHQLLVAVRGGGHSLSGQSVCENGLMIDLAPMRSVRVDAARKSARVEPGVLLGELDRESLAFGLVTTTGTVSHTGAAGLTLGGGFGRLARRFALACDNVTTVDVVTASGRLLQANTTENPDLYWGLRGGGGNFGVVTSFEYRLFPFDGRVYGGHLIYPFAQARDVLRGFADAFAQAPDELWIEPVLAVTPTGDKVAILDVCYSGSMQTAERALAPYRRLGKPLRDELGPAQYAHLQSKDDERARIGRHYYTKSGFVKQLESNLIDVIIDTFAGAPVRMPRVAIPAHGGAMSRVARDATAFWHRDALHSVILQVSGDDSSGDVQNIEWVKARWPAIEASATGFYVNINPTEVSDDRMRGAYGGNYDRLVALKSKYDPNNLFRLNANVRPRT